MRWQPPIVRAFRCHAWRNLVTSGLISLIATLPVPGRALAGDADVIGAVAHRSSTGRLDLDVTIRSMDTGWDRYADRIEVLTPDGTVIAVRVLEHPHETEQPFTRDVPQVDVPRGVDTITIRVRFKPSGYDGAAFRLPVRGL